MLLAAAKSKAQTSEWPKSLDALVPGMLDRVPTDPLSKDGKDALGYYVKDGHACIASAGLDHIPGTDDDQPVGDFFS